MARSKPRGNLQVELQKEGEVEKVCENHMAFLFEGNSGRLKNGTEQILRTGLSWQKGVTILNWPKKCQSGKTKEETRFPVKGVLGCTGQEPPFTPRTPFKGNFVNNRRMSKTYSASARFCFVQTRTTLNMYRKLCFGFNWGLWICFAHL